jgi:hypothetical protein
MSTISPGEIIPNFLGTISPGYDFSWVRLLQKSVHLHIMIIFWKFHLDSSQGFRKNYEASKARYFSWKKSKGHNSFKKWGTTIPLWYTHLNYILWKIIENIFIGSIHGSIYIVYVNHCFWRKIIFFINIYRYFYCWTRFSLLWFYQIQILKWIHWQNNLLMPLTCFFLMLTTFSVSGREVVRSESGNHWRSSGVWRQYHHPDEPPDTLRLALHLLLHPKTRAST